MPYGNLLRGAAGRLIMHRSTESQPTACSRRVTGAWYEDPYGEAALRWWDGSRWTGHVWNADHADRSLAHADAAASVDAELARLAGGGASSEIAAAAVERQSVAPPATEARVSVAPPVAATPPAPEDAEPEQSDVVRRVLLAAGRAD